MSGPIALVGTGLIGRGWAIVFARSGHDVRLYDAHEGAAARAHRAIQSSVADLAAQGLLTDEAAVLKRITVAATLSEALTGAIYVQESVPEDVDIKAQVFAELDRVAPADAVIGSSASAIPASRFTKGLSGAARCLVAHPANPPHLMPLVELVPAPWTDAAAVATCRDLLAACGQVPVTLNDEITGFVMNRLQTAVVNEAMSLAQKGVMSPADIDATMRYSIGMRWAFMGPFETMDLNAPDGFADYCAKFGGSYMAMGKELNVADPWDAETVAAVEAWRRTVAPQDKVADRQAWRDKRLAALGAHIRNADKEFGT